MRPFGRQWFLDLDDQIGPLKNLRGRGDQFRAAFDILLVQQSRTESSRYLEEDLMSSANQFLDPDREHRHTVLIPLHFLGNTNNHRRLRYQLT